MTMMTHPFRSLLLTLGLVVGTGSACDVEDLEDLDRLEDLESIDETDELDEDRAAPLSCSAIAPEATVCIGDSMCSSTAHGVTTYRFMPPGGCNANETQILTPNSGVACDAASAVVATPTCPDGCGGPVKVPSQTATCCTVKNTCYDKPTPVPVPVDETEPVEGEAPAEDADADAAEPQ